MIVTLIDLISWLRKCKIKGSDKKHCSVFYLIPEASAYSYAGILLLLHFGDSAFFTN